jgi:mono/diheme cytochrome c family protein
MKIFNNLAKFSLVFYLPILLTFSCKTYQNKTKNKEDGLVLLEQNCYSCHSPKAEQSNRLAPPMMAVKKHYYDAKITESEFIAKIADFVMDPSAGNSKMPGAKNRFGLMPKLEISRDNIEKIAKYIYKNDIESPAWFEKHYQEEMKDGLKTALSDSTLLSKGQNIAQVSQQILGKNLMAALSKGGAEYAMEFCNTKALFLTDSLSHLQNTNIKRVSDKNRNPSNYASNGELAYINLLKSNFKSGISPKPKITKIGDKNIGYYPIVTNAMCMQCHGNISGEITSETLLKIRKLYPNDQAVNYKPNDIRGLWVVEL